MDFRLKVFATAAKTLNFSTTAQMLGISQSAVSQHIKLLEDKYKVELFARRGNKYVLTYAGEVLLQKALKILELHNEMEKESECLPRHRQIPGMDREAGQVSGSRHHGQPDLTAERDSGRPGESHRHRQLAHPLQDGARRGTGQETLRRLPQGRPVH